MRAALSPLLRSFLDFDLVLGLDSLGLLGRFDFEDAVVEFGFDLRLVNGVGETQRTLECAVAALLFALDGEHAVGQRDRNRQATETAVSARYRWLMRGGNW